MNNDKPIARWYLVECYSRYSENAFTGKSVAVLAYSAEDAIVQHNLKTGRGRGYTEAQSVAPLIEDGEQCEDCRRFTVRRCDQNDARSAIYCAICKRIPRKTEPVKFRIDHVCTIDPPTVRHGGLYWCSICGAIHHDTVPGWRKPTGVIPKAETE